VEVTQEKDLYLTEPLLKDIGGRACKRKHKNMLKNVISVRDLRRTFISPEEFLNLFLALGLLLSGAWILWVLSLRQEKIKSIYWLAQTISPNRLKLNLWRISEIWMSKDSSRRISLLNSAFAIPSSRKMAFNLIAKLSGSTVLIWG